MDAKRLNELKELLETIRPKCGTPLSKTHPIVVLEELLAEVERLSGLLEVATNRINEAIWYEVNNK
jgi:hypothetical protein